MISSLNRAFTARRSLSLKWWLTNKQRCAARSIIYHNDRSIASYITTIGAYIIYHIYHASYITTIGASHFTMNSSTHVRIPECKPTISCQRHRYIQCLTFISVRIACPSLFIRLRLPMSPSGKSSRQPRQCAELHGTARGGTHVSS